MKNKVELIDYMGSDNLHALAAWASTFLEFGIDVPDNPHLRVDELVNHILNNGKRKRKIEDLISYLAENEHTSPFRFSSFVFGTTQPIDVHIQKLKHAVLLEAENSSSARYKELEDKYYLPEDWDIKIKKFEVNDGVIYPTNQTWSEVLKGHSMLGNELYHESLKQLSPILGKQRAKESSRYFKMYNTQIDSLNKFSFDGVIQFYKKRNIPQAQLEIQEMAKSMIQLIKEIPGNPFQYSLKAFGHDVI